MLSMNWVVLGIRPFELRDLSIFACIVEPIKVYDAIVIFLHVFRTLDTSDVIKENENPIY